MEENNGFAMKTPAWICVMIVANWQVSRVALAAPEADQAANRKSGIGTSMIPPHTGNPVTESMTDEQLIQKRLQASSTPADFKPLPPKPNDYGLLEMSSILESTGNFVLLPKGSILFCPEGYRARWVTKPTGRYTVWRDFLTMNRNWITTREVTNQEVSGEKPFSPEVIENFKKTNLVVIATQYGNPITVLTSSSTPAVKSNTKH